MLALWRLIILFFKQKTVKYQSRRLRFKYIKSNLRLRQKGKRYCWYTTWWSMLKSKRLKLFKTNHWIDFWIFKRKNYRVYKKVKLWALVKKIFKKPILRLRWKLTRKWRDDVYFLKNYPKMKNYRCEFVNEYYWCVDTIWSIPFDVDDIFICTLYYLFFYKDGLTGIELMAYGYIIEYVDIFHLYN